MRDEINVKEGDLLWFFYCKFFSINGKEIIAPQSLCPYFWTAVNGFGLWLGREVKMLKFLYVAIVATILFVGTLYVSPNATGILAGVVYVTITIIWCASVFVMMIVFGHRLVHFLETQARWAIYLFVFGSLAIFLSHLHLKGVLLPEAKRFLSEILQIMKYGLVMIVGSIVLALGLSKVPSSRLEKVQGVLETFAAFLKAQKNKVCPPVNPPPGFGRSENQP